jgi:hypothetical protein
MRYRLRFILLLLTAGLSLMPTGRLLADDGTAAAAGCKDRLIRIEQRLAAADVAARKEAQIRQIIDGARTLDQLGDAERCTGLADQLDRLLRIF